MPRFKIYDLQDVTFIIYRQDLYHFQIRKIAETSR